MSLNFNIDDVQSSSNESNAYDSQENKSIFGRLWGGVKSLAKGAGQDIANLLSTGGTAIKSSYQLARGDVKGANKTLDEGVNIPFYGKVAPNRIGREITKERIDKEGLYSNPFSLDTTGRTVGTGIGVGSWVVGGGEALTGGKALAKEGLKSLFTTNTAKAVVIDSVLGAVTGLGMGLEDNQRGEELLKSALFGAGTSVVAPRLLGGMTKLGMKSAGKLARGSKRVLEETAEKLDAKAESYLANTIKNIGEKKTYYDDVINKRVKYPNRYKLAKGASGAIKAIVEAPQLFSKAFVNKYEAIGRLLGEKAGKDIEGNITRSSGLASDLAQEYVDIAKPLAKKTKYGTLKDTADILAHNLDDLDRLKAGKKIENGRNLQDVFHDIAVVRERIPPEDLKLVQEYIAKKNDFTKKLLQLQVDAGNISQEDFNRIIKAHPNYIPHQVLDFLDEDYMLSRGLKTSQGLKGGSLKEAKGSLRKINRDTDQVMLDYVIKTAKDATGNKTINNLIEASIKQFPEETRMLPKEKIKSVGNKKIDYIKEGLDVVKRRVNGVDEEWLVPKDIAWAIKRIDPTQASSVLNWLINSKFGKIITAPTKITRNLATIYNPTFTLFRNPLRDIQTAYINGDLVGRELIGSLYKTIMGKLPEDKMYREALKEGAFHGSIVNENKTAQEIMQDSLSKKGIFSKISHPAKAVADMGDALEKMTRYAVYKSGLSKGLSPRASADLARRASVDFSRSGSVGQIINQVIPFFNARIQGTDMFLKAMKKDPTKTYRKLMWTAGAPALLLYAHNHKHESYKNIPDSDKQKYWVIMVGETDGVDYRGKPIKIPHYIKIPKGEPQMLYSAIVDRTLNKAEEEYPEETSKFLGGLINNSSPVNGQDLIPPGIKQAIELKANYSFFRDKNIVPDWIRVKGKTYKRDDVPPEYRSAFNTSEVSKYLGKVLKYPPAKIDYLIKLGVMKDLVDISDLALKANHEQQKNGLLDEDTHDKWTFERASNLPVLGNVISTRDYGNTLKAKRAKEKEKMDAFRKKIESK